MISGETSVPFRRHCAVCGGTEGRRLFRQRFAQEENASFLAGYDVVVCGSCGFAFADGIPDQAWFDAYYRELSKYEDGARGGNESPWEAEKLKTVSGALIPHLPRRDAQIVDIGCSTGRLLACFRAAGFERVLGVDPSPACSRLAMERFGIQVKTATFSNLDLPKGFADVLILCGVLEHVRDLGQALDRIAYYTSTAGHVFICVPDASRYAEAEDAPFQGFSMEHINFFSPESLANLMATRGFTRVATDRDMLRLNHRTTEPVVYGVFCRTEGEQGRPAIAPDTRTISGLREYIAQSQDESQMIHETIGRLVREGKPLLVWGVGTHTLHLLAESPLKDANILAFVDGNPRYHGRRLLDRPVCSPEILRQHSEVAVLISSRAYQEEIAAEIVNSMKCANLLVRLYSLGRLTKPDLLTRKNSADSRFC